jgi:hypothetical protein
LKGINTSTIKKDIPKFGWRWRGAVSPTDWTTVGSDSNHSSVLSKISITVRCKRNNIRKETYENGMSNIGLYLLREERGAKIRRKTGGLHETVP